MPRQTKIKILLLTAALFLSNCTSCNKTKEAPVHDDKVDKKDEGPALSLSASPVFAKFAQFHYRSDMTMATTKAGVVETDTETIEIIGAKPRVLLKKKTDSAHFIEIIADGDTYFVRSGGKPYRRGADNNTLYATLMDDGFNVLRDVLHEFALTNRLVKKAQEGSKVTYDLTPGPVSADAPFMQALFVRVPTFKEIVGGDVSGSFSIDVQSGLPLNGSVTIKVVGNDDHALALAANFSLEQSASGEEIALPSLNDDEPTQNYPVDISRRFNELMEAKEGNEP